MASLLNNNVSQITLTIDEVIHDSECTFYVIKVSIGSIHWVVKRRYKEFFELHEKLVNDDGVMKDLLPSKKIIGNKDPTFIEKRRKDLESYIKNVMHFLEKAIPDSLVEFLDLQKYEIHFLLKEMARLYYGDGDRKLEGEETERYAPLQLNAISTRLRTSHPTQIPSESSSDFVNVADFCCQLKNVSIVGSDDPVGTSNVREDELKFDLAAFKSLRSLTLLRARNLDDRLTGVGNARSTLERLEVHDCDASRISDVFLCGEMRCADVAGDSGTDSQRWTELRVVNFSSNRLHEIDPSVKLAPKLEDLNLGHNAIEEISNLTSLPNLRRLDLSHNRLTLTEPLNTKLGNVVSIDVSNNRIKSLRAFSKLYSLVTLEASNNDISELQSVYHISKLPCLELLNLQYNPVTVVVDYRIKVLESFAKRCSEVCLDAEFASQKEIDKVSVLMALRVTKEGLSPTSLFGNLPPRR